MEIGKLIKVMACFTILLFIAGCSNSLNNRVELFPEFSETDMDGNIVTSEIFKENAATVINFWYTGCGSCVEEMPELEVISNELKEKDVQLVGLCTDATESAEFLEFAKKILSSQGVTYLNIMQSQESDFNKDFVSSLTTYPVTFVVNREGHIVGKPIYGNVKQQISVLNLFIDEALRVDETHEK